MDLQYEQRLRDEVIYLHSLWHQGPPRPPADVTTPHRLQPVNTTQFKKEPRGKKGKKFQKNPNRQAPDSKSSPGAEWPCPTPPAPQATSDWPSSVGQPVQSPLSPSPEEQSKLAAKQAQHNSLKTVREFFRSNNADSESDSIDNSSDEDDEFMEEGDGRHYYTFFLKLFMEDADLKEYCERNYVKGEFSCLICGVVGGKNTRKRFKGCLALVQHSITIAKTKKRRAHRAYAQAVCKVLGWDIDRLPTIASLLNDNSIETQESVDSDNKDNSISLVSNMESGDGNGEVVPENATIDSGSVPNANEGIMNSLTAGDANNTLEGLGMVHPFSVEETVAEGLTSNSLTAADANSSLEGLGMVQPFNVEETVTEGLASNSFTAADPNNTLEGHSMVHPFNVEETVAEGLTSNPLTAADPNNTLRGFGMVHPFNVEYTVAEGLTSNSLTTTGVNNSLDDLGMVHSFNVDEMVSEELASGPFNENSGVGMGIAILDGLKEDDITED